MAGQNRPNWHAAGKRWKCRIDGKVAYFPKEIGRLDKPIRDGVPVAAWRYLDGLLARRESRLTPADPTCEALAEAFVQWLGEEEAAGRITAKHRRSFEDDTATFVDSPARGMRASAVTVEVMDEFFEALRSTPTARSKGARLPGPHHVANVGKAVRAMFRWAARPVKGRTPPRLVHPNPLDGYTWPRQPGAVRGYVEGEVVRRFLRWAWARARWDHNDRIPRGGPAARGLRPPEAAERSLKRRFDRIFVLMMRFERLTGCRPGEACGLEWSEIQPPPPPPRPDGTRPRWEPTLIKVRQDKVKTRRQTDRERKIHVTPPVARLLRALERLPGRHPRWAFTHMRGPGAEARGFTDPVAGEPWPSGSAASQKVGDLREAAVAAGVEGVEKVGARRLIAYACRHGYASEVSSAGFSDEQIAEQLGNTPEVIRRVYAHSVDRDAAARAVEIAEKRRASRSRRGTPPASPPAGG